MIDLSGSTLYRFDSGSRLPFQSSSRTRVRRSVLATSLGRSTCLGGSSQTTVSALSHTRSRTIE